MSPDNKNAPNISVQLTLVELATDRERSCLGVIGRESEIGMVVQLTSSLCFPTETKQESLLRQLNRKQGRFLLGVSLTRPQHIRAERDHSHMLTPFSILRYAVGTRLPKGVLRDFA